MAIVIYALAGVVVLIGAAAAALAPTANMGATEALFARLVVLLPASMFALVLFALGAIVGALQRLERRADTLIGMRALPQPRATIAPEPAAEVVRRPAEIARPPVEEPPPLSPSLFEPPASPPPPTAPPPSALPPLIAAEAAPPPPRIVAPEPAEPPPAPSRPGKPRLEVATFPRASLGLTPRPDAPPPAPEPTPPPPPPPSQRPLAQIDRPAEPVRPVMPTPPLDLPPPPEVEPRPHEPEVFADDGPAFDLRLPDLALGPPPPSPATERERSPASLSLDELLNRTEPARPLTPAAAEPQREAELPRAVPLSPAPPPSAPAIPPLPSFDTGFLAKALLEPEPPARAEPEAIEADLPLAASVERAGPPPADHEPPLPTDEHVAAEPAPAEEARTHRAPTIAELLERDADHEPQEPEPSARIVREGQFAGRRYRMFENGSLEIDTDQSTIRFGSLDEFRAFVSAAARKTPERSGT